MQQQDSYSNFTPLRQSSLLTDETLLMNGTDVYANASVVWPALHKAKELELERAARQQQLRMSNSVLEDTIPNELTAAPSVINETNEETIWMTALDITFSPDASTDANNQSLFDVYRSVLEYTNKEHSRKDKLNARPDEQPLDDTLPMDDMPLDDTLPMDDDDDTLDDTLPMDDDDKTLDDTLSMDGEENLFYDELWMKKAILFE